MTRFHVKTRVTSRLSQFLHRIEQASTAPTWQGRLLLTGGLLLPWAVYTLVLQLPWPDRLLANSYGSSVFVIVVGGPVAWVCYRHAGWTGSVASLSLALALFALPLLALWNHLAVHYNAIGGLLPFSDAGAYYHEASRLLEGHLLGWSARRPLFVGLLSSLLGLTSGNLQMTLALLVALNATACFVLVREIRISHGTTAAVVVFLVLFLFYRVEGGAGTTLTENLGYALGMIGFAVLWQGIRERRVPVFSVGFGLLMLALLARAGAFFVLPALLLAGARVFGANSRSTLLSVAGVAVAMSIAVAANLTLVHMLSRPTNPQTAFSNFSYSLYGLVVGGKGWGQVLTDHPDASEGAEIYGLAWEAFEREPLDLVRGSLRMWREYLPGRQHHALAFVRDPSHQRFVQNAFYLLCLVGLVECVRRRDGHHVMLAAGTVGHLASIPFVPPIDAGLRVYAATIPLLAILAAIGARTIGRMVNVGGQRARLLRAVELRKNVSGGVLGPVFWPGAAITLGLVLAALATLGPILMYSRGRQPEFGEVSCPDGQMDRYVRLMPGSVLRVHHAGRGGRRLAVPDISTAALRRTAGVVQIKGGIDLMLPGHSVAYTHDLKSGRPMWLVIPTHVVPNSATTILGVCGMESADPQARAYGVFHGISAPGATPQDP